MPTHSEKSNSSSSKVGQFMKPKEGGEGSFFPAQMKKMGNSGTTPVQMKGGHKKKPSGHSQKKSHGGGDKDKKKREALKKVAEASKEDIKKGIEYLKTKGYFGKKEKEKRTTKHKSGIETTTEGKAEAGAGANASLEGEFENKGLLEGIKATLEMSGKLGAYASAEGEAGAAYGVLAAKVKGEASAMIGAEVSAEGSLEFSALKGLEAEGSAEAFIGTKASAETSLEVSVGSYAIAPAVEGEVMAGAGAKAEGTAKASFSNLVLEGELSAFAGATAEATVTPVDLQYKGKTILKIEGEIGGSVGAGGDIKGGFSYENGVLEISGSVLAAIGLGGKLGGKGTIDLHTTGVAITDSVKGLVLRIIGSEEEKRNKK